MFPSDLAVILQCPDCGGDLDLSGAAPHCLGCGRAFTVEDGILSLLPSRSKPLPAIYGDPDYRRMSACFDDSSDYFTDGNSLFKAIHDSAHRSVAAWEGAWPTAGWTLDIGCGQGYHWPFVADRSRLIGMDIRMESLKKIRRRFPDAILVQANLLSLPFKAGTIVRATSIYALEHIYYLEDALAETARVLADGAKFLVGLPCEGGLGWTLGRKLTSERAMSQRYGVDYRRYIALEHCNTAARIEKALWFHFRALERKLFPLGILPLIDLNLTLSLALEKRPPPLPR